VTPAGRVDDVAGRALSAGDGLVRSYRDRTPGSAASLEAAKRVLPGPADLDDIAAAYATAFTMLRPHVS
jgi:hypothetical protein